MFCTNTGQTGKDAYIAEAAEIAEAQNALDKRFRHLRATVAEEAPELFEHSADFAFSGADSADHFAHYLTGEERVEGR